MVKKIDVDFLYTDDRGTICQILSNPIKQVNYLFTKKGAKRGQHYHKENREIFYVIDGKIQLSAYNLNFPDKIENQVFKTGDLFILEPYTMHNFEFLQDTQMTVMYDMGVEVGNEKDIYTE